ncbi:hypothetical protein [Thalassotalea piscium]|uniref:Uncharacterized protein n=1 Tax=Thalassotalea piscium TaxID=1230533 RepID=A0A7X0NGK1_9GAMM|nr:hypothetical protein [Thalassotalea piscium]MBB6543048.1 hypothetical protein [Thalassotalea piscium]
MISLDISGSRGKLYGYKGINGVPDAIFRHLVKPKYIVGELKGRRLNPKAKIRGYEYAQIMLYIGILKKKYWLSSVEGRLVYKDSVKHIYFERNLFNEIIRMKPAALTVINRLQ